MDQIARDGTMLASDLNAIEDEIKEGFVRVKMLAKEVKEEKAVRKDEEFVARQVERIKDEVRRMVDQLVKVQTWKEVLRSLNQDNDLKTQVEAALTSAGGNIDPEDDDDDDEEEGGEHTHTRTRTRTSATASVAMPDLQGLLMEKVKGRTHTHTQRHPVEEHAMWVEVMGILEPKEDDDLEIVETQGDDRNKLKCPITIQIFVKPMRNKVCGHTYSEAGIMQSLRSKNEVKCPVPGCNKPVKRNTLESDREMEMLLKRHERMTQAQTQHTSRDDDGAEEIED